MARNCKPSTLILRGLHMGCETGLKAEPAEGNFSADSLWRSDEAWLVFARTDEIRLKARDSCGCR
jgi:hypothetical protein